MDGGVYLHAYGVLASPEAARTVEEEETTRGYGNFQGYHKEWLGDACALIGLLCRSGVRRESVAWLLC